MLLLCFSTQMLRFAFHLLELMIPEENNETGEKSSSSDIIRTSNQQTGVFNLSKVMSAERFEGLVNIHIWICFLTADWSMLSPSVVVMDT